MDSYIFESPIGLLKICEKDGKLTNLYLLQNSTETGSLKKQSVSGGLQNPERHSELLCEAAGQIREYFAGKRKEFNLPVSLEGTSFQQRVWQALQEIPYGETRSYEDIAIAVGNKKAVRAVGQANNKNPLMIIVPCHRVIHKSGEISGFACGTDVKKYLLDLEKKQNSVQEV